MVALREDLAGGAERVVQRAGQPDREAAHGPDESLFVVGLHQEVDVVALDGEVDDARGQIPNKQEGVSCMGD